ncbi:hypothetical protein [Terrabacter sp. BE26]|uniref:hypothetical protein n=1 Tax=Terrabacter sp. BE26 TaxID=2898152 RepID=UPI0035BE2F28
MRYAKLGLLFVTALGLLIWSCYAAVVGVAGGSEGRIGAGVAAAASLVAAIRCGIHIIRSVRSEANGR